MIIIDVDLCFAFVEQLRNQYGKCTTKGLILWSPNSCTSQIKAINIDADDIIAPATTALAG